MAVPSSVLCRSGAARTTTPFPLVFSKRAFANNAKPKDDDDDTAADDDAGSGIVTTMAEEETRRRRKKRKLVARQFTIFTCGASACTAQRQRLGLDEFATFTSMYVRANADDTNELVVPVMETRSCLGACQYGPCVAIGHEEYEGMVALTGMDSAEFTQRVFFRIIDDNDVDRVWRCVVQAIDVMAAAEEAEDEDRDDAGEEEEEYAVNDDHDVMDRYV
jgi:hypothetical protein